MSDDIHHLIIEIRDRTERVHAVFIRRICSDDDSIAEMLAYLLKPVRILSACEAIPRIGATPRGTRVEFLPHGATALSDKDLVRCRHAIITFRFRKPVHFALYDQYSPDAERDDPVYLGPLDKFARILTRLAREETSADRKQRPSYAKQLERQRARRAQLDKLAATAPRARSHKPRINHGPAPENLKPQPITMEGRALAKLLSSESPTALRKALAAPFAKPRSS